MTVKHAFVSAIPEGNDPDLVRPSNWNAAHVVPGAARGDMLRVNAALALERLPLAIAGGVLARKPDGLGGFDPDYVGLLSAVATPIVSDQFTYTSHHHVLSAESDTEDDCSGTLFNITAGGFLMVSPAAGHRIKLKHFSLPSNFTRRFYHTDGQDIVMSDSARDWVLYFYGDGIVIPGGYQELLRSPHLQPVPLDVVIDDAAAASTTLPRANLIMPFAGAIAGVEIILNKNEVCGATPLIADIHLIAAAALPTDGQGLTVYTTQANRPTVANTNRYANAVLPDLTAFAAGDALAFYIDQAGTGVTSCTIVLKVVRS